jgi:hypothetical protein
MIAQHFPPAVYGGVFRPLKFAKYLPEFGWEPTVVAATNLVAPGFDRGLLSEIEGNCRVVWTKPHWVERLRAWKRSQSNGAPATSPDGQRAKPSIFGWLHNLPARLLVPDPNVVWKPLALRATRQILRHEQTDAIWTTAPPNSTHFVGLELKRLYGLRWVCDFRDHWIDNPFHSHLRANPQRRQRESKLEAMIVQRADVVVSTTEGATRNFQDRYPDLAHKFVTIANGFDEADFDGGVSVATPAAHPEKFLIRYVGSIGGGRQADDLLVVLRSLQGHALWRDLRVEFLGPFNQPKQPWNDTLGDRVQFRAPVPHREALREMRSAAILLLVQNADCGPDFAVPGKAYEYGAAGVPILALAPGGEVQKLLERYRLGQSVDSRDHTRLAQTLLEMYEGWRRMEPRNPDPSFFERFSRRAQTEALSTLLGG